jgi:hypothetical protein
VIRLHRPAGDQRLCALIARFGDEEFQFTGFVTAEGKSGLVVAFDEDTRSSQMVGKTREFLDRGWEVGEMESGDFVHKNSLFQSYSVVE